MDDKSKIELLQSALKVVVTHIGMSGLALSNEHINMAELTSIAALERTTK